MLADELISGQGQEIKEKPQLCPVVEDDRHLRSPADFHDEMTRLFGYNIIAMPHCSRRQATPLVKGQIRVVPKERVSSFRWMATIFSMSVPARTGQGPKMLAKRPISKYRCCGRCGPVLFFMPVIAFACAHIQVHALSCYQSWGRPFRP